MKNPKDLIKRINEAGFTDFSDFVTANLHYLPEDKRKLFCSLNEIETILSQSNVIASADSKYSIAPKYT